jgi:SAM-dependent methyltransferase
VAAERKWLFDRQWTQNFTKLRQDFAGALLTDIRKSVGLETALDVGCGLGDFAKFLSDLGLRVSAVDGRVENVTEAKNRYPEIAFQVANVEELSAAEIGQLDLVLCFGLLYHLENPFRAIRNLYECTGKVLLIETMCAPDGDPTMHLLDEGVAEDQGLNYVAFYPSESCLVKMLYRAGFACVYLFDQLPANELYAPTIWKKRPRTMMAASKSPLNLPRLVLVKEPIRPVQAELDPWATDLRKIWVRLARLKNSVLKPLR